MLKRLEKFICLFDVVSLQIEQEVLDAANTDVTACLPMAGWFSFLRALQGWL